MSKTVLSIKNLSKVYRLGETGTGTLSHDLNRWWCRIRGKEDPYLTVGVENDRSKKIDSKIVKVLDDISFDVKEGEVLGIIGKNGAGKSTLLKLISRITAPTGGAIKVKGRIASLLEVGTGMHPEMTARENIYLNGSILGMTRPEIESKFNDIVEFSGCQAYLDTPVKRFSSGMRVRLGFAVAAFLEPEILIVDEVLAVGDDEFQQRAIGRIKEVSASSKRTVLFVSHNMSTIQKLCTSCILLENGRLVSSGPTAEVVKEYMRKQSENSSFVDDDISANSKANITSGSVEVKENEIFVSVTVFSKVDKKVSLDCRVTDGMGNAVAFGSLGTFNSSDLVQLSEGTVELKFSILSSNLAVGDYYLSLDLTVPDIEYFDRKENCLFFQVIRKPERDEMRVLDQRWGFGSISLNVERIS